MPSATTLRARLTTKRAQLAALNAAFTALSTNAEISSYEFESGAGRQRVTRNDLGKIAEAITYLESQIDQLERQLCGRGLMNLNLRRY